MDDIIASFKQLPKEFIMMIILDLMREGKITFHDIAEIHAQHLEELFKGTSRKLQELVGMVTHMHIDKKANYDKNMNRIMHYLIDEGRVNVSYEDIDKRHNKRLKHEQDY